MLEKSISNRDDGNDNDADGQGAPPKKVWMPGSDAKPKCGKIQYFVHPDEQNKHKEGHQLPECDPEKPIMFQGIRPMIKNIFHSSPLFHGLVAVQQTNIVMLHLICA